jgi:hypothetical protein
LNQVRAADIYVFHNTHQAQGLVFGIEFNAHPTQ